MRALLVILSLAVLTLAGCSKSPGIPTSSAEPPPAEQGSTDFDHIPGQFPTPATITDKGQAEAPVGSCVNLSGTAIDAALTIVDCGSMQSTYRIIRRVVTPEQCGDADRVFYNNSRETGQFTACLDLAWDRNSCIALTKPVVKVACNDPNILESLKIKPDRVILNTITFTECAHSGYQHPLRRFTVCTGPAS